MAYSPGRLVLQSIFPRQCGCDVGPPTTVLAASDQAFEYPHYADERGYLLRGLAARSTIPGEMA